MGCSVRCFYTIILFLTFFLGTAYSCNVSYFFDGPFTAYCEEQLQRYIETVESRVGQSGATYNKDGGYVSVTKSYETYCVEYRLRVNYEEYTCNPSYFMYGPVSVSNKEKLQRVMENLEATLGQTGAVVTKDYVSLTVDRGCSCAEYRQRLQFLCEDSDNTDSDGDGVPDCVDPCPDNSTPECREIPASQEFGEEELHGKSDQEDNQSGGEENQGEPINIFIGNNNIIKTDISFNSPFQEGFSFRRSYNSQSAQNEILGSGWTHSYHVRLFPEYDMANNIISVINGSGRNYLFQNNGSAYTGINQEPGSVIKIDSTYVWRVANGKEYTFGLSGALQTISDKNGNQQVLSYNSDNLLKTVTDLASGRVLTFH